MSAKNKLRGLDRQLREKNPIIDKLMNDFNNDREENDMAIENAVYGIDNFDINDVNGVMESFDEYDEDEDDEEDLEFEDLDDDEEYEYTDDGDDEEEYDDDYVEIDDGIDSDLGEDNDDPDEDIDLEDVMEAVGIYDSMEDKFKQKSELDDYNLDFIDDEL